MKSATLTSGATVCGCADITSPTGTPLSAPPTRACRSSTPAADNRNQPISASQIPRPPRRGRTRHSPITISTVPSTRPARAAATAAQVRGPIPASFPQDGPQQAATVERRSGQHVEDGQGDVDDGQSGDRTEGQPSSGGDGDRGPRQSGTAGVVAPWPALSTATTRWRPPATAPGGRRHGRRGRHTRWPPPVSRC
jgi:hypothetical protein